MKVRDYRLQFINSLEATYGRDEAESFFYLILESIHQLKRIDLALTPELSLTTDDINKWDQLVSELKNEIPIQYLLGTTSFCGFDFTVNSSVLIPRPETEELVDWIVKSNHFATPSILDIGTGSGCIAISLAKLIDGSKVVAFDISAQALAVANSNARNLDANVDFRLVNILETPSLDSQFDIIVSNPPYVRELEKSEIKTNVIDNEPHLALFVDDTDPLIFYRKIADLARTALRPKGFLYFEINQYFSGQTVELLTSRGFEAELRKDIYGNDRMIKAQLK